jgi:hypothetical protein
VVKRGFSIAFPGLGEQDAGVHRIRNWAEDLFGEVRRRGWGQPVAATVEAIVEYSWVAEGKTTPISRTYKLDLRKVRW